MTESPSPLSMLLFRHTRRRELIALLGGAALTRPKLALAQDLMRCVGMLMPFAEDDPEAVIRIAALRQKLQELGWAFGRNFRIEPRWAGGDLDRTRMFAAELAAIAPDVILAAGTPALTALTKETRGVPIVFVAVPDPVGQGLVASLARPGGNATGFANLDFPVGGKWLELLTAIAPGVSRVILLFNPETAAGGGSSLLQLLEEGAGSLSLESTGGPVHERGDIERTIATFARGPNGGMLVLPDNFINAHRELIVALAEKHRLPAIYPSRFFVTAGGLVSYGIDVLDMYRGAASYIDRILKGANPGDLPVQQPTKFELVINLKTAKAFGLTVPPSLLARADEVIE
jgi:putative tryptophan/tyrosine transport system substrate-binding protein